jgi:hypothetical protein
MKETKRIIEERVKEQEEGTLVIGGILMHELGEKEGGWKNNKQQ